MKKEIVHADIDRYLYSLLPERDAVLREMEEYAVHHLVPIVGPTVGRLLYLLARMNGARRIFEMGSAIGYSTLWLALAAGEGGEVYYTDGSAGNAKRAERYLKRAGVLDRVRIGVGDAGEILAKTRGRFDLIFNDVDKEQYPGVFPLAVSKLKKGGLLLADNTIWGGRVVRMRRPDPATEGVLEWNRLIYASTELFSAIVPLRDGLSVSLKE